MPAFAPQQQAAYALKPLEIQPTTDGYLLREQARRLTEPKASKTSLDWMITLIVTSLLLPLIVAVGALSFISWLIDWFLKLTFSAIQLNTGKNTDSQIGWLIPALVVWLLLVFGLAVSQHLLAEKVFFIGIFLILFYCLFGAVYWSLRLLVDGETRQHLGFKLALGELEVLFSHYPPRIGDGDRLTIRRHLKPNRWTKFFSIDRFPQDSRMDVNLVCIERVTYTQGTDSITNMAEI